MEFLLLIISIITALTLLWGLDRAWHQQIEIFASLLGAKKVLVAPQYQFLQTWQNLNWELRELIPPCYSLSSKLDITVLIKFHGRQFLLVSENVLQKKSNQSLELSSLKTINVDLKFFIALILLSPLEIIQRSIASAQEMPIWMKRGFLGIAIFIFVPFLLFISIFVSKKTRLYSIVRSPLWWLERWSVSFEMENSILMPYFVSVILC